MVIKCLDDMYCHSANVATPNLGKKKWMDCRLISAETI